MTDKGTSHQNLLMAGVAPGWGARASGVAARIRPAGLDDGVHVR